MVMRIPLLIASANAAQQTWEGGPTFDITYDAASTGLKFDVTVPANMWWGISYAETMTNVDQVVFAGSGDAGTVTDLWSTGYSRPTTDTSQDYTPATGTLADDVYTFAVTRPLDTGDSDQDQVLACGNDYEMEWTANKDTADLNKHTTRAGFTLKLAADCTATIEKDESGSDDDHDGHDHDSGVSMGVRVSSIIASAMFISA